LPEEPQGQLLGETSHGELLQQPEERAVHGTRYATRAQAVADLFDRSPVQFLQDWITSQHEQKIAA
jgi:hypothetical protein